MPTEAIPKAKCKRESDTSDIAFNRIERPQSADWGFPCLFIRGRTAFANASYLLRSLTRCPSCLGPTTRGSPDRVSRTNWVLRGTAAFPHRAASRIRRKGRAAAAKVARRKSCMRSWARMRSAFVADLRRRFCDMKPSFAQAANCQSWLMRGF
jgi:hypothetical protein